MFVLVDTLAVTSLMPYTLYTVRLAALNAAGRGQFSDANSVRTLGIREYDTLTPYEGSGTINPNSIPLTMPTTK